MRRNPFLFLTLLAMVATGCTISSHEKENGNKDVAIKSPFGNLKVQTDKVEAQDTGLSVFPGSTIKPKENNNDSKANVNVDTPWFNLKVVAVTYLTDAPQDKVWDYYRSEMAKKWGKPLECREGSPDMDKPKAGKHDLSCRDDDKGHGFNIDADNSEMQLKVGSEDYQRIVAIKTKDGKTQYSLVYLSMNDGKDTI